MRRQGLLALGVVLAAILLSIVGMPVYLAMLFGVLALLFTRVIRIEDAYRSIEWQVTGAISSALAGA